MQQKPKTFIIHSKNKEKTMILLEYLKKQGISQVEMAKKLSVTAQTISNYIVGRSKPTIPMRRYIALCTNNEVTEADWDVKTQV